MSHIMKFEIGIDNGKFYFVDMILGKDFLEKVESV